jgi:hypothetical protein
MALFIGNIMVGNLVTELMEKFLHTGQVWEKLQVLAEI